MMWPPPRRDVIATFDARADRYDDNHMHRWVAAAAADLPPVRPGERILDAKRRHSAIGMMAPVQFEHHQQTATLAA